MACMVWCSVCYGVETVAVLPPYTVLSPPPPLQSSSAMSSVCVVCLLSAVSYTQQTLLGGKEKEARDAALGSLASEMKVREGS